MSHYVGIKRMGKKWFPIHRTIVLILFGQLCILLYPNSHVQSFALLVFPYVGFLGIAYGIVLIVTNVIKNKSENDEPI